MHRQNVSFELFCPFVPILSVSTRKQAWERRREKWHILCLRRELARKWGGPPALREPSRWWTVAWRRTCAGWRGKRNVLKGAKEKAAREEDRQRVAEEGWRVVKGGKENKFKPLVLSVLPFYLLYIAWPHVAGQGFWSFLSWDDSQRLLHHVERLKCHGIICMMPSLLLLRCVLWYLKAGVLACLSEDVHHLSWTLGTKWFHSTA